MEGEESINRFAKVRVREFDGEDRTSKRCDRDVERKRNSCTHDQWYKITVSCKQRISSARLMAAWVAVRASRVLHKQ